jgi:hypothetical protein
MAPGPRISQFSNPQCSIVERRSSMSGVKNDIKKDQFGFVMLGGRKILVTVRAGNSSTKKSKWITMRRGEDGSRLEKIEKVLKKKHGAAQKLLDGKMQAI